MALYQNRTTTSNIRNNNSSEFTKLSSTSAYRLPGGPKDGISHISWSREPNASLLACGSWDNSVLIWQIGSNFDNSLNATPKCMFSLSAPVLTSCFASGNTKLFAGGCDKMIKIFDLNTGSSDGQQVAQHDQPICKALWCDSLNTLVTASWDGYIRMWDGKSSNPVWQYNCGSKIYAMDMKKSFLVVADGNRKIILWNLGQIDKPQKMCSALKMMTRSICVSAYSAQDPFIINGSIDGRCGILHIDNKYTSKNFCFRCHRNNNDVYAVNGIDFHASKGIFATCGGDKRIYIWNLEQRQRLKSFEDADSSVVDVRFNPVVNNLLACAVSYDWHKGLDQEEIKKSPNAIYLVMLSNDDLEIRSKQQTNRR